MSREFDPFTLRLFVAVCEERSIARAAAREALVASAVSKRIAAVEREVGTPLLLRGRRGIEPTAAGETLLRQARDLLAAMRRMQAELSEFTTGVRGSVRVMASVSALAERLPGDIADFLAEFPDVRVSLDEGGSPDIVRSLHEGATDIGVLWDIADLTGLQSAAYHVDRLCVVMPASHALAVKKKLWFHETLDHPSIGVATQGPVESLLRREAALHGRELRRRVQVGSLDASCRIIAAGLGLAVLPKEAVETLAGAAGLAIVPLADDWAERTFVVCSRHESMLSATARILRDRLAQCGGDAPTRKPRSRPLRDRG